jgi:hypothetical protein
VAPLHSTIHRTASRQAGGLRVPDFPAWVPAFRDAPRPAVIGGRPFRACSGSKDREACISAIAGRPLPCRVRLIDRIIAGMRIGLVSLGKVRVDAHELTNLRVIPARNTDLAFVLT